MIQFQRNFKKRGHYYPFYYHAIVQENKKKYLLMTRIKAILDSNKIQSIVMSSGFNIVVKLKTEEDSAFFLFLMAAELFD